MKSKYKIFLCMIFGIVISISPVFAESPYLQIYIPGEYYVTNYWDNLDTPTDINLSDLGDVTATTPSDDDLLSWDTATSRWISRTVGSMERWVIDISGGYLYNSSSTVYFNETYLNITIDSRASGLGDNSSWNKTYANSLYVDVTGDTMTGNLNMNDNNITTISQVIFTLGETIDNLVNGWIQITGSLNVTNNLFVQNDLKLSGFTNGSILFIDSDGRVTQNNSHLYYEADNGGKVAIGNNSKMNNAFQVVKDEGITNVENIKALIVARNKGTTNNNWAGFSWQTYDTGGDVYSGARILTQFTSHSVGAVSGDLVFDTRHLGTRSEKMRLSSIGNLNMSGNITSSYFIGDGSLLTGVMDDNSSWNKSYGDTLYSGIEWDYNQTNTQYNYNMTIDSDYDYNFTISTYNLYNAVWISTYNVTYDSKVSANSSFTQALTDTLYSNIQYNYNMTINSDYDYNMSDGSDNSSWNYSFANTLYSGIEWDYNMTIAEEDPIFSAWNNFTGIPHATPSNGDVTHFSLADEIYDWIISLLYITQSEADTAFINATGDSMTGNLNFTDNNATGLDYVKFTDGGYMYDNGTALIIGYT